MARLFSVRIWILYFKKGDTAENPPHIEGDRFYGLGSADCKGGLLVSIYGVKILQENGFASK